MLGCWYFRRQLTALADEELAPRRAARVRAHVDRCAGCAAMARELEETRRWLEGLSRPVQVPDVERLYRGVVRRLEKEPVPAAWPRLLPLSLAGTLVAAALLLAPGERTAPPEPQAAAPVSGPTPPAVAREQAGVPYAPVAPLPAAPQAARERQIADASVTEDPLDGLPAEVLARPEFFRHYRLFEKLEAIEHFESVRNLATDGGTPEQPHG